MNGFWPFCSIFAIQMQWTGRREGGCKGDAGAASFLEMVMIHIRFSFRRLPALLLLSWAMQSCQPDPMEGGFNFNFSFSFEGEPLRYDSVVYTIASGNQIRVGNIQYFISDVALVDNAGNRHRFQDSANRIHYVDSDIPETMRWETDEAFETGVYEYVEFTYGLDSVLNRSHVFRDPPESGMFWPEALGGGYHYMKLNGYWRNAEDSLSGRWETFGFHAGIGQTWQGGTAVAFHQNYRRLIDTVRIFLTGGEIRELTLDMDVAEWFCNPHVWDFNYFGGAVMQDQEAQQAIRDNASGVFSIQ